MIQAVRHGSSESGFTTVELLITLFIGALFIMTGYQLYTVVIKDGANARIAAKAANIAYEYLAQYQANVPAACIVSTVTPTPPSNSDVPGIAISVNTTCPYGVAYDISRIEVVVSYGSATPKEKVSSVVYAEKS